MRKRFFSGLTLCGVLLAAPAAAQQEVPFGAQEMIPGPWKFDNFPYFTVTPNDGFMFIGRAQYGQAADFLDRVSMARRFAIEGGLSPSGSRFVALMVDMPRLAKGWRLAGELRMERNNQFGAFWVDDYPPVPTLSPEEEYSRARRVRTSARVELTRTIVGSLAVAASGTISRSQLDRLPSPILVPGFLTSRDGNDAVGRLALVLDLRDSEFDPQRGVLIEGGVYAGTYGEGYGGGYAIGSGFINPRFGTVIAARVGGRSVGAASPVDARYSIPAWERPLTALGGPQTHRALDVARYGGQGVLFGSMEIRQMMIDGGDMLGVYGVAFVDVGRTFEQETFRLTTEGLKVGGGLGIAIRVLRANIFNTSVATGPDGVKVMVGSGWMF